MDNQDNQQNTQEPSVLKKFLKYTGLSLLGLFALLVIVLIATPSKPKESKNTDLTTVNTTEESKPIEVPKISAVDLLDAYEANEVAADTKFKGKFYDISGVVDKIGKDILNNPYVTFDSGKQIALFSVQASFDKSQNERLAQLTKGQGLTVRCEVSGKLGNVLTKNCIVISQ